MFIFPPLSMTPHQSLGFLERGEHFAMREQHGAGLGAGAGRFMAELTLQMESVLAPALGAQHIQVGLEKIPSFPRILEGWF